MSLPDGAASEKLAVRMEVRARVAHAAFWWLDSSRVESELSRFSFIGTSEHSVVCLYDLPTRTVTLLQVNACLICQCQCQCQCVLVCFCVLLRAFACFCVLVRACVCLCICVLVSHVKSVLALCNFFNRSISSTHHQRRRRSSLALLSSIGLARKCNNVLFVLFPPTLLSPLISSVGLWGILDTS